MFREWENLTARWFYEEVGRKHRRCGSAKVVRDLYKREKDLMAQQDEDLGYDTLRKSLSADSGRSIQSKSLYFLFI